MFNRFKAGAYIVIDFFISISKLFRRTIFGLIFFRPMPHFSCNCIFRIISQLLCKDYIGHLPVLPHNK